MTFDMSRNFLTCETLTGAMAITGLMPSGDEFDGAGQVSAHGRNRGENRRNIFAHGPFIPRSHETVSHNPRRRRP
jgi:hypothetical protein